MTPRNTLALDTATANTRGNRVNSVRCEAELGSSGGSLSAGLCTSSKTFALEYPDAAGERVVNGVAPNEFTASEDRDWLAGTPWHKHVRAQIEAV